MSFNDRRKFLLGNVPAYDVLRREGNKGLKIDRGVDLLFAGMPYFTLTLRLLANR